MVPGICLAPLFESSVSPLMSAWAGRHCAAMRPPRNPLPLLVTAIALLLLWAWLFAAGTILVVDRSGTVARAEVVTGLGVRPLRRLPSGLWAGLPSGDGTVRLVCRDGSAREHGYVTSATHVWLWVAEGGRCGRAQEL